MKRETLSQLLTRLEACDEAKAWAKGKTRQNAWAKCQRGDWMIWLLTQNKTVQNERLLRLLACDIAETVLHLVPAGEDRPRIAIETARRFADGQATAQKLAAAVDAAWSAKAAGVAGAAAWAARSAGDAAWSAKAAAWAAARAAGSAGDAAWSAKAAWDAWDAANRQHADLVRKWFPEFPTMLEVDDASRN